jgi:glycolate oxidase iron-sulfur subunit
MQHKIDVEQLGPQGEIMAHAIEACVHCGFCLPACPTYQVLGEEMDSPRGRIFLMKEVLEGSLRMEEAQPYLDKCLGCQGCVSACPSGVPYGELISTY